MIKRVSILDHIATSPIENKNFHFAPMSDNMLAIPPGLPENVRDWKSSQVLEFFNANSEQYDLVEQDIKMIRENRVGGIALLRLTTEELRGIGLALGPAAAIAELIDQLKRDKGVESGKWEEMTL